MIDLASKVRFLTDTRSYPRATSSVEARETHMSWVFLTDDRVYKLKKPVRYPFLDFSTLARRLTLSSSSGSRTIPPLKARIRSLVRACAFQDLGG